MQEGQNAIEFKEQKITCTGPNFKETETRNNTSVFLRNFSIVQGASMGSWQSVVLHMSCNTASILNLTRSFARSIRSSSSFRASYTLSMYVSRLREVQLSMVRPGSMAASTLARWGDMRGLNASGIRISTRPLSAIRSWKRETIIINIKRARDWISTKGSSIILGFHIMSGRPRWCP